DRVTLDSGESLQLSGRNETALVAVQEGVIEVEDAAVSGRYEAGTSFVHRAAEAGTVSAVDTSGATVLRLRMASVGATAAASPAAAAAGGEVTVLATGEVGVFEQGALSLYLARANLAAGVDTGDF